MTLEDCDVNVPISIPGRFYRSIENRAVECLVEAEIKKYPIDSLEVVKNLNIPIAAYYEVPEEYRSYSLEGYSLIGPTKEPCFILYNECYPKNVIRFTILHELGHVVFKHKEDSELARKIADHFAGYAIAPPPLIDKMGCKTVDDIMSAFEVTEKCAIVRLDYYNRWKNHQIKNYEKRLLSYLRFSV